MGEGELVPISDWLTWYNQSIMVFGISATLAGVEEGGGMKGVLLP